MEKIKKDKLTEGSLNWTQTPRTWGTGHGQPDPSEPRPKKSPISEPSAGLGLCWEVD